MEETTTPSPEYLKGFNEGYTLAKESPALADQLSQVKHDGERIKGFHDGRRQFVMEKVIEERKGRAVSSPPKSSKDKSRDRDYDIEKE